MKLISAEMIMAYKENMPLDSLFAELLRLYCMHALNKEMLVNNKSELHKAQKLMREIWQRTGQITFGFDSLMISVTQNQSGRIVVSDHSFPFIKPETNRKHILVYCAPSYVFLDKNNTLKVGRKKKI